VAEDAADGHRHDGRRRQWTPAATGQDHTQAADHVRVRDRHVWTAVHGGHLPQDDVMGPVWKWTPAPSRRPADNSSRCDEILNEKPGATILFSLFCRMIHIDLFIV